MTDMEQAASNLLKIMDAPLGAQWRNVGASLPRRARRGGAGPCLLDRG